MSLLLKTNKSSFLDHRKYTERLYKNVIVDETERCLALSIELFSILNPENKAVNRKRGYNEGKVYGETMKVKEEFNTFLTGIDSNIQIELTKKYNISNTQTVRNLAQKLNESTVFDHTGMNGGNNSEVPLQCNIKDEKFLIPEKSRYIRHFIHHLKPCVQKFSSTEWRRKQTKQLKLKFFCGCVKQQCLKLSGNKYNILIADPPWWNKYIRRLKGANDKLSYSMMYNEDIASIPVKDLLSPDCLVAVWCTNAPSNISAVKDLIFPSWGVEYVTTWYWLKVTVDLQPICAFSEGCKKQPFERIILGKVGEVKDLPDSHLIVSLPSALHSHKPPLLEILSQYVNIDNPQVLELFARYLLPNTTSVGYEPLKWQHISLYEEVT